MIERHLRHAKPKPRAVERWAGIYRRLKQCYRFFMPRLLLANVAQIELSVGVARLNTQHGFKLRGSQLVFAFFTVMKAQRIGRHQVRRLCGQHVLQRGNGLIAPVEKQEKTRAPVVPPGLKIHERIVVQKQSPPKRALFVADGTDYDACETCVSPTRLG